jgi:phenylalanyl-tRNA synthetase alpha chain
MADEILLSESAYAVWQTVKERGPIELGEVATITSLDQAQIAAAITEAAGLGFIHVDEREREEVVPAITEYSVLGQLPEVKASHRLLKETDHRMPFGEFVAWAKSENIPVNEVLKWGQARNWLERVNTDRGPVLLLAPFALAQKNYRAVNHPFDTDVDDYAIERAKHDGKFYLDQIEGESERERARKLLTNRPQVAKVKKRTERTVWLTAAGKVATAKRILERNTLTPDDLESGAWREIKLRPYDVTLAARDVYPAKIHPLRKIIEQTRRAFLEMGFAEVVSPMIESAFWNFDALYQPQDHPARDMQDTFYMRDPAEAPLPDDKIVEPVRRTHENGWTTKSEGWGYKWSPEVSRQVVLRTHTTAATIRALAANPNPPGKFFCVGWTYRNETISFKHLPVFHQVDGIIVDEEANLASLMGTLQEFYSKMGFGRVKFKPAFYPYTEPSVDVVVYMESRKKWLEMGGAGIFRPEVTLPLGCNYPVLAWGLGIERLAMLRFGLSDIRDLYGTNLDALQQVPLCR